MGALRHGRDNHHGKDADRKNGGPRYLLQNRGNKARMSMKTKGHQNSQRGVGVRLALPLSGRQKVGDGKPSPYRSVVIDGLEARQNHFTFHSKRGSFSPTQFSLCLYSRLGNRPRNAIIEGEYSHATTHVHSKHRSRGSNADPLQTSDRLRGGDSRHARDGVSPTASRRVCQNMVALDERQHHGRGNHARYRGHEARRHSRLPDFPGGHRHPQGPCGL